MDQQLIAKITELVISKLTDEINSEQNIKNCGLTDSELQDWQANNLLRNDKVGQFSSTQTYNLQTLSIEELNDWQSLNVYHFSSNEIKGSDNSNLIKFKKFN
ncbi:hypothetical protein [Lysinibacillus endophyticus]|uniref:hypothetical protein n=1 Tax=Ureibacillus endophyticus TaxID=1978490 RepID=UPI00209C93C6|nr:hypothetical protein [Lysinibacillus endophyticus]MCP1143964.1 hypothetical protein [Lysinibacillus endophyticus]